MLKYTKFDFGRGFAPDSAAWGAHIAPQNTLAAFEGSYFYQKEKREGKNVEKE